MIPNTIINIIQNQNLIFTIEIYFAQEVKWLVAVLLITEWFMLEEIPNDYQRWESFGLKDWSYEKGLTFL
jgi:hypothetical protein